MFGKNTDRRRNRVPELFLAGVAFVAGAIPALGAGSAAAPGPVLLADDTLVPHVRLAWETREGWTRLECDRQYRSPEEREPLAGNISCFVALGGTRLDRGAGDPRGAVVRVGFYKIDVGAPFFADMKNGGDIEIELSGVRFNQPVEARVRTVLQHLKYTGAEAVACGLSSENVDFFNTADPSDDLRGKIPHEFARFGSLVPGAEGGATTKDAAPGGSAVSIEPVADGSITMRLRVPYAMLRHARDPWKATVPGTFFEPYHFHVEFEVLPEGAGPLEEPAAAKVGTGGPRAPEAD